MSKTKTILTILFLLGALGLCAYLNRDWFATEPIQISHRVTPGMRGGRRLDPLNRANPVVFSLGQFCRLTEIKVVVAAEFATNRYAPALWHLVSPSNSVFLLNFNYGERIRGMTPKISGVPPDPLAPGVTYRLLVKSDQGAATHDFSTTARP